MAKKSSIFTVDLCSMQIAQTVNMCSLQKAQNMKLLTIFKRKQYYL